MSHDAVDVDNNPYENILGAGIACMEAYVKEPTWTHRRCAERLLKAAINKKPNRNEARVMLAYLYIGRAHFDEARELLEKAVLAPEGTDETIKPTIYGGYPSSILAHMYLSHMDLLVDGFWYHMKASMFGDDSMQYDANHQLLLSLVRRRNVGIVLYEQDRFEEARWIVEAMASQGKFDTIMITANPHAATYARKALFYIGDNEETLEAASKKSAVPIVWLTSVQNVWNPPTSVVDVLAYPYNEEEALITVEEVFNEIHNRDAGYKGGIAWGSTPYGFGGSASE